LGGGFIEIIDGWQNLWVNPPLQILLFGPIPNAIKAQFPIN